MTKKGYDKEELLEAGLAVKSQKGSIYDRFRNRLMDLEEELGVDLELEEKVNTVGELVDFVESKLD